MAAAGSAPQFASLYVGDLHPDVTEAMLYEIFNSVGPVASIRVCRDSVTRKSLGYAYVNFHAVADAERALDTLNYSSIKGRACRIMWSQRDPSLRKSGLGNVFVKSLDRNIDNKALYDTFSLFGNILSCKVASDKEGKSKGYGFVHYETEEAAKQAIERVNGMQIGEKTVQVEAYTSKTERMAPFIENYTNVYVKSMPEDWDDAKINELFGPFGTITSVCVMEDKKGRRFAFVNYEDTDMAKKACESLHKTDVRSSEQKAKAKEDGKDENEAGPDGHPVNLLYVSRAQTKTERIRALGKEFGPSTAPQKTSGVNLYIKNLDEDIDDESLKALFAPFGNIGSAKAMLDDKGKCKGFGFVAFSAPDEATKAVTEMHLKVVKGKPLYVGLAEKKDTRQERLRQRYTGPPGGGQGGPAMGMGGGMCGGMGGGMGGPGMGGMCKGGKGVKGMGPMGGMGKGGPMPGMMGGAMQPMGGMMPGMAPGGMNPMMMQQMMMQQKAAAGMMGPGMMGCKGQQMMPQMMGGKPGMPPQMMAQMGKGMMPGMMPGMGMKGMMPGMMGGMMPTMPGSKGMPGMMPPQQQQQMQQQQQLAPAGGGSTLTASALAAAPPAVQKQMIGEKLYPAIAKMQPELAGKITGMMLEMDNSELLMLLESENQLRGKVDEAIRVLESSRPGA